MQPVSVQDSLLLAFSPDLEFLAVGTRDSRVKAFDTGAAHALPDDQLADLLAHAIILHTEDYVENPVDSIMTRHCHTLLVCAAISLAAMYCCMYSFGDCNLL